MKQITIEKRSFWSKILSASVLSFMLAVAFAGTPARADVDPAGCTDNGGGVSVAAFRADGTTNIGSGTVTDGEAIKYKATLSALPTPNCAFEGGTWTLTTPDGVSHNLGAVPRIGGTGVASLSSALIPYTVNHADEQVNSTRHIDAITSYSGGKSHADTLDETAGPTLGASKILKVVHTPTVTTNVHDANHAVITSAPIGSSVHDQATVTGETGGPVPTGTVNFNLYPNTTCEATPTTQSGVALTAGVGESSATTVPTTGLSYKAHYNGDGNYLVADGACEPLTATKLDSRTSTDVHSANHSVITSATVGDMVHDNALVTGTGGTATGNVSFQLYSDGVCTATNGAPQVVALDGTGHAETTPVAAAAPAMSYKASYAGNDTYNASEGACEPLTVNKLTPSVVTEVHNASEAVVSGSVIAPVTVHDKATVSGSGGTPTGTVDFSFYTSTTCSSEATPSGSGVSLVSGVAHPSSSQGPLSAGSYGFKAHYNGDATYSAADGECEPFTVVSQGHIIVDKVTNPSGDSQSFDFTAGGAGYTNFSLTDATAPNDQTLNAGTYSVSETLPSGWVQTSATCDGQGNTPASITLAAGQTVTCTFTNTKKGHLIVDKVTDPTGDTTSFPINATGSGTITGGGAGTITDAANKDYEVTPGTYSVTENTPSGWNMTGNTCTDVAVGPGETKTCTITNTKAPVLQYCSPGYWKNHPASWTGYTPSQLFSSVFEQISIMWSAKGKPSPVANPTLQQALEANGGGINQLARATVNALLNTSAGLTTGFTTQEIIDAFNAAVPGTDSAYSSLAARFTAPENCPLH
ncbi:MAG: hypothetical protein PHS53_00920 [Candidatus Pacebacteria bacterium]|nr:hypothetical protein [Candidatus Paceibacterota bacterium]